ncbi:protein PLASTID REDOX INSENSITIVE 2, chloroplastic [Capsella rubella]|uniref:protein PLASTID REDOX INSENSITIVE 2, chloroplastic n=1 Tax=Capsella rubella TaxID=81985 RepID=UPI000CD4A986|nr:protein PLASTID REDOX INSENSITIVE 2, chloroplastic [Capsella rubella]XP_023644777.1 protein PLASTID REDOX INSENSITIVE 2, chloroplastic [Capsella rubella]
MASSMHEALFSARLPQVVNSSSSISSSSSSFRCALPIISSPAAVSCAIKSSQSSFKQRCRTKLRDFSLSSLSRRGFVCKAAEYKFPDPIPEFAEAETEKFRDHMLKKLSTRDLFEDSVDEIVGICTEIFGTFLRSEYGGPGTLLVIPFIDMADTLNERELPGGPQAARAAIKWAQNHVDKDWKEWTGTD